MELWSFPWLMIQLWKLIWLFSFKTEDCHYQLFFLLGAIFAQCISYYRKAQLLLYCCYIRTIFSTVASLYQKKSNFMPHFTHSSWKLVRRDHVCCSMCCSSQRSKECFVVGYPNPNSVKQWKLAEYLSVDFDSVKTQLPILFETLRLNGMFNRELEISFLISTHGKRKSLYCKSLRLWLFLELPISTLKSIKYLR